ncbi:hypothetical protein [Cellulomonas soli]|uniref:hypothetical protein n=1 Tax=Cellulomonas soli TaxID=931535 RepID=UPI0015C89A29|nr:hypothetical protein [Cellulomonas soli]NYI58006.1 hypothetical protein [Cellulomonas soli]
MGDKADDLGRTLDADLAALGQDASQVAAMSSASTMYADGLRAIVGDLGITGSTGDAASDKISVLTTQFLSVADRFDALSASAQAATTAIEKAQAAYAELPDGELSVWQKAALTAGGAVVVPGVGAVAAAVAAQLWSNERENGREQAAGEALSVLQMELDAALVAGSGTRSSDDSSREALPPTGTDQSTRAGASSSSGTAGNGSTAGNHITWTDAPTNSITTPTTGVTSGSGPSPLVGVTPAAGGTTSSTGGTWADGHLSGGTVPGGLSSGGVGSTGWSTSSGSGLGATSGFGGAAGGALAGGLAVGGAALGTSGLARAASSGSFGSLPSGTAAGLGSSRSGVLGGSGSTAGSAASTLRGTSGSSLTAGSSSATTSTGTAGTARGGSSSGMMPGGGTSGKASEKRRRTSGGLIAPAFDEDDAQVAVPLSAGARAGSRDQLPALADVDEPDDTW